MRASQRCRASGFAIPAGRGASEKCPSRNWNASTGSRLIFRSNATHPALEAAASSALAIGSRNPRLVQSCVLVAASRGASRPARIQVGSSELSVSSMTVLGKMHPPIPTARVADAPK